MMKSDWTDERVADLRSMWERGDSASEIRRKLGVSRNAVLGKVFRLGLSKRKRALTGECPVKRQLRYQRANIVRREKRWSAKPVLSDTFERKKEVRATFAAKGTSRTSVAYRKHLPKLRQMSKSELRAMLTAAVINTVQL